MHSPEIFTPVSHLWSLGPLRCEKVTKFSGHLCLSVLSTLLGGRAPLSSRWLSLLVCGVGVFGRSFDECVKRCVLAPFELSAGVWEEGVVDDGRPRDWVEDRGQ